MLVQLETLGILSWVDCDDPEMGAGRALKGFDVLVANRCDHRSKLEGVRLHPTADRPRGDAD